MVRVRGLMVSEFYARRGVWVVTHGGVRNKPKGRKLVMNLAQSKGYRRRPRKRPRLYTTPGSRKITAPSSIDPAQVQEVNCHRLERARPYPNIHAHMHTQADANGDPYPYIMRQAPTPRSAWKRIYPLPGGPHGSLSAGWQRARIGPVQRSPVPSPTGGTR